MLLFHKPHPSGYFEILLAPISVTMMVSKGFDLEAFIILKSIKTPNRVLL